MGELFIELLTKESWSQLGSLSVTAIVGCACVEQMSEPNRRNE